MQLLSLSFLVTALTTATLTLAAPGNPKSIINGPPKIPGIFKKLGGAASAAPLDLTFHLKPSNLDGLTAYMEQNAATLATPLTPDQVAAYVKPSDADINTVQTYLLSQGFKQKDLTISSFKDEITVTSTVGQGEYLFLLIDFIRVTNLKVSLYRDALAAKMFATTFDDYSVYGLTVPRADAYTIPTDIASQVTQVTPINSFINVQTVPIKKNISPSKRREIWAREFDSLAKRAGPASCSPSKVTPACLRDLYGTSSYTPKVVSTSYTDVLIAGFISQSFSQSDETSFLRSYRSDAANYRTPIVNRANAVNVQAMPGIEAMLDTETVASQIYPLRSVFYNYGNQLSQGDIFQRALADIKNNYNALGRPGVYSISYGADESSSTPSEASLLCSTAQQLSAMGMTIVLSSGDNGVGGSQGDSCPAFVPTYPSGCPYILSVGATQNFGPEVAVDTSPSGAGFYSGSGFSNLFARPSYQNASVTAYINSLNGQNNGYYNKAGRGYPDVSAQGSLYVVTQMGFQQLVSGTSASAPTTASIIALLNNARQIAKKGNIGWFNPFVYANAGLFNDVTSGSSAGCAQTANNFPTKAGWDASTGVGTPNFQKLRTAMGV